MMELVAVMVVIGILALVAIPRLDGGSGFDERGFHDQALATLQYARKIAVASRRHVCVTINASGLTVQRERNVPEAGAPVCADALELPGARAACGSNKVCVPGGVSLTGSTVAFHFDPLGRASAAVALTVSGQPAITIDQETGYVR